MAPPRPASPLVRRHLLTLGADPPRMVDPDEPGVALLGPSKPLALLVYLASRASRSATRDHLVDLLWADRERAKALQSLRQTLIEVRKRVGEGVVHARDDALVLDDGVTFDVVAFERAIAEKAYAAAAALWAGDFFPGFAAPGGREFERWLDGERQRIRRQFLHVAAEQVRATMGGPHAREAVALARRARDAEPLDEGAWRLVVQSLVAARDVVGARAEADACERMAAVEGIDLSMATHDALRAARRDEEAAADARAREAHGGIEVRELVGRAREFAALLADWERARAGHGGHVHLTAPAGLGKTRLLQDLRARLRATRARVVTVRAARGERALPYAFAAHVAARLGTWRGAAGVAPGTLRVLSALSPGLADPGARASTPSLDVDSDAVLVQRALALAELVAAVSAEAPVALLLDDMHWADDASRVVFGMLASQARDHPILVVTAARPPLPIALEDGARLVDLTPLGVDDVWSFVAAVHELPDAPWVSTCIEQLAHVTGGSPLLLLETLQLLHDRARLTVVDDRWHCPDEAALLAELRGGRALDRRVDALEPAA
ncbi:MAG: AAA family ATPase, partial [Gemmatimonadaceae bacterium]|nr:AAA family ATPase [Gemmatimonadaceae bacterium]